MSTRLFVHVKGSTDLETKLGQKVSYMTPKIGLERFLASDQRQTSSQFLSHEMTRLSHLLLVRFGRIVLRDQLTGRYPGNSNRPLHDRDDDLRKKKPTSDEATNETHENDLPPGLHVPPPSAQHA